MDIPDSAPILGHLDVSVFNIESGLRILLPMDHVSDVAAKLRDNKVEHQVTHHRIKVGVERTETSEIWIPGTTCTEAEIRAMILPRKAPKSQ